MLAERTHTGPNMSLPHKVYSKKPLSKMENMNLNDTKMISSFNSDGIEKNVSQMICAFCNELLSRCLPGEIAVSLTCGDMCHKTCFGVMVDRKHMDRKLQCGLCRKQTWCTNNNLVEMLVSSVDNEDFVLNTNPDESSQDGSSRNQFSTPRTHEEFPAFTNLNNEQSRLEIYKPQIELSCDPRPLELGLDKIQDFKCVLTVKAPQIFLKSDITSEDVKYKNDVEAEIYKYFHSQIKNWQETGLAPNPDQLGNLVMFDNLYISTNEVEWDIVKVFLFSKIILFSRKDEMIGKIMIREDISSINKFSGGIILNLRNGAIPEFYFRHTNPLIIAKWESIIIQYFKWNKLDPLNRFQITTNAFEIIPNVDFPEDVRNLATMIDEDRDIPSEYFAKSIALPEPYPLNLIICVPLANLSGLPNSEYKRLIIDFLHQIRQSLRVFDRMGLVFTGRDGNGKIANKGTFVSCTNKSWTGWDRVLNDVFVYSEGVPFSNETEELKVTIDKIVDLKPFVLNTSNFVNKVLILNGNNYRREQSVSNQGVNKIILQKKLNSLLERFSITILRVGGYTESFTTFNELIMNPNDDIEAEELVLSFGSSFFRFDSFSDLNERISYIMNWKIQQTCIPSIRVDISKFELNQNLLKFNEIEINGLMKKLNKVEDIVLFVKDITPGTERNIIIGLQTLTPCNNRPQLPVQEEEMAILQYTSSWITTREKMKICYKRLDDRNQGTHHENMASKKIAEEKETPPAESTSPPMPSSPLTSESLARRQMELSIMEALLDQKISLRDYRDKINRAIHIVQGYTEGSGGSPGSSSPADSSSSSQGSRRGFCCKGNLDLDLEKVKLRRFRDNSQYSEYIARHLEKIRDLDASNAALKCQDLHLSLE